MSEKQLPRVVHEWEIELILNQGTERYRLVEVQRSRGSELVLERQYCQYDAMRANVSFWKESDRQDGDKLRIVMAGLRDAASKVPQ